MTDVRAKSKCFLCGAKYTMRGFTRHIATCLVEENNYAIENDIERHNFFHLFVSAKHMPEYWLHIKAKSSSSFSTLDSFLRKIWLECCGHLSAFYLPQFAEIPMSRKLSTVLQPKTELRYEYDFGSTTELKIKAVGQYTGPFDGNRSIQVISRNNPPIVECLCGKATATKICPECGYEWICDSCAEEHEDCGLMPVVNSPRTGVCGYVG